MRRVALIALLAFAFVLSGCVSSQSAGQGVEVSVLNRADLSDVYIPFDEPLPSTSNIRGELESLNQGGDRFVKVSDMSLLVHNRGYADSLVALYVTGYDPNLFAVLPTGPFRMNPEAGYCYKDIVLQDDFDYSVYALCAAGEDLMVGGGLSRQAGAETASVSAYNANVGDWLSELSQRLGAEEDNLFSRYGSLLNGITIDCDIPVSEGETSRSTSCRLSSQFLDFVTRRSSRGSLLLAWFGGDVRDCGNGCTLVPAPQMPRSYIAGDTEQFPGGEGLYVDYNVFLNRDRWPANLNDHDQLFQISACYLYTTYATPIVCVDPTPQSSDGDVCRPGVQEMGRGQPAPLAITSVEQTNQGPRVMFTIKVRNELGGRVFHPGAIDFCAPGAPNTYSRELKDVAKVIDARVLGELEPLDCRDGTIRLDERGQGQINCFMDIPREAYNRGAYQTTLNIEIGYLYRDLQTVQSSIHRI